MPQGRQPCVVHVLGVLVLAVAALSIGDQIAAAVPTDFTDTLVASLPNPTALAFTPDGRMLITTQVGNLHVLQGGTLSTALALGTRVCTNSERGLLGVAVDPAFASNGFIYLYYTSNTNGCVNRLSRFVLPTNNQVDVGSEFILLNNMSAAGGNHNAGDVKFGKDGYLYVSVGDAGSSGNARNLSNLNGKILRIMPGGGIPPTNPYQGGGTASCATGPTSAGTTCREIFAWGLRNPFRMAFDPNTSSTRFFINDVGQNTWEEIDIGASGADYGWSIREGHCANGSTSDCGAPPSGMTNPIYDYQHSTCTAITAGAFVPNGVWPASYNGTYLYTDYACGRIFTLGPQPSYTPGNFATGLGNPIAMMFGPYQSTQALYYTVGSGGGQVRRISYSGTVNQAPNAVATATPTSGAAPLSVNFDGTGSSDPDGNPITHEWDFGDGSPHDTGATTGHVYSSGVFTATLTVRDSAGASGSTTIRIDSGNTPPAVQILAPTEATKFRVGQTITLRGQAFDNENGQLADSRLSWTVLRRHNTHTHPYMQPTSGNNINITTPGPEDFAAAGNSYLEIYLTATDLSGLSTTILQDLKPNLVNVTFETQPAGLRVDVNGVTLTPQTVASWEGYDLAVSAPTQLDASSSWWKFADWSDGGAAAHTITTPASDATYTVHFAADSTAPTGLLGKYYNDPNAAAYFSTLAMTRVDPSVNFDWGGGSPGAGVQSDNFTVRWTGELHAPVDGAYTLSTTSDDGVRLTVNGQLVINNWTNHSATTDNTIVQLSGGIRYPITMEFYERGGGAVARLLWTIPGQNQQIVPQTSLYPAPQPNQAPTVNAGADQTITLPNGTTLMGAASDDAQPNPPGAMTYGWTAVGGPGTPNSVTFGSPGALSTSASFSEAGTFTLRLSGSDGVLSATDDVVVVVNAAPPPGSIGTGLVARYYNDPSATSHFTTTPALTRTDATVDFSWGTGAPGAGVQANTFSARWTGQVLAPVTGAYTFITSSDDGIRLWLNGQQVINNWTDHGTTTNMSAPLSLTAGTKYDLVLEFYENAGGAVARLLWSYPGQAQQVIPQPQLFPSANVQPSVNAGADRTITLPNGTTLMGSASDDAQPSPPGAMSYGWTAVSGPGTPNSVTFGTPSALTTTASFSEAGTFTLRLTASDGALSAADDVVVVVNAVGTTGTGLTGRYFNDPSATSHFTTTPVLTRTDATVDFSWGTGAPGAGVQANLFSVRWTGQVLAPLTGAYTFVTSSDDGIRVWVNGQQVINNWTDHGTTTNTSAPISLTGGTKYDVVVEYYENAGGAVARLLWSYPGQAQQVVPQAQLFAQ